VEKTIALTVDFILKMVLSAITGKVFGFEKAKHGQAAGIRTNMMISLASCLFTYIGVTALPDFLDIPRILVSLLKSWQAWDSLVQVRLRKTRIRYAA